MPVKLQLRYIYFSFTSVICFKRKTHTKLWWGNLKGRDKLEDIRVDGKILEWILGK
jgi:hypothetical protein